MADVVALAISGDDPGLASSVSHYGSKITFSIKEESKAQTPPSVAEVEAKYTDRFDDTTYYG